MKTVFEMRAAQRSPLRGLIAAAALVVAGLAIALPRTSLGAPRTISVVGIGATDAAAAIEAPGLMTAVGAVQDVSMAPQFRHKSTASMADFRFTLPNAAPAPSEAEIAREMTDRLRSCTIGPIELEAGIVQLNGAKAAEVQIQLDHELYRQFNRGLIAWAESVYAYKGVALLRHTEPLHEDTLEFRRVTGLSSKERLLKPVHYEFSKARMRSIWWVEDSSAQIPNIRVFRIYGLTKTPIKPAFPPALVVKVLNSERQIIDTVTTVLTGTLYNDVAFNLEVKAPRAVTMVSEGMVVHALKEGRNGAFPTRVMTAELPVSVFVNGIGADAVSASAELVMNPPLAAKAPHVVPVPLGDASSPMNDAAIIPVSSEVSWR